MSSKQNILILMVVVATVIGFYVLWNQNQILQTEEDQDYNKAEELLSSPQPLAAMNIIQHYQPTAQLNPNNKNNWLNLKINALSKIPKQGPALMELYQSNPKAFDNQEVASQMVAGMFLADNKKDDYRQLKKKWDSKTKHPQAWFALDSYDLIQNGKPAKAIAFIHSGTFSGQADPEAEKLIDSLLDNLPDNTPAKQNLLQIRKEFKNSFK